MNQSAVFFSSNICFIVFLFTRPVFTKFQQLSLSDSMATAIRNVRKYYFLMRLAFTSGYFCATFRKQCLFHAPVFKKRNIQKIQKNDKKKLTLRSLCAEIIEAWVIPCHIASKLQDVGIKCRYCKLHYIATSFFLAEHIVFDALHCCLSN